MATRTYKSLVLVCLVSSIISAAFSHPAKPAGDKVDPQNLKFTFGSNDEIPAAFFESTPLETRSNSSNTSERRVYPPCQDGSGGMCVDAGTCPSNLKPERSEPGACARGQECCFGAPSNDKTCSSRGGECVPKTGCGSAPTFLDAVDCDQKNGQICCILI